MLVNTQYFREAAIYFQKHGEYPCGKKGSVDYKKWWYEEAKKSLLGYSVGGVWIPGYYYYYLNFCPIDVVKKVKGKSGSRPRDFPSFWDQDYRYFMSVHIARYGIHDKYLHTNEEKEKAALKGKIIYTPRDYFKSLPVELNIQERLDNLQGGKHIIWLKGRGVGASFKGASMTSRNYHLVKDSKTFLFADQKEYLTKDGVYSKFTEYMDWLNLNTEFKEYHEVKGDRNNMHFVNSYYDSKGNVDGLKSQVLGTTINNDYNKARGKRGILALFEEAGRFGSLTETWNVFRDSVEENRIVYGLLIGFGTGGTEGADFRSMELMFNAPEAYNILAFNNIYDVGMEGRDCGLFTPAYYQIQNIDKSGNSDIEKGKVVVNEIYEEAKKSPDPTLIVKRRAEQPTCPQDAMLNTTVNKFASEGLISWRNKLFGNSYYKNLITCVKLQENENGEVISKLNTEHPPIFTYPHSRKSDLFGSVVEFSKPYKFPDSGEIPNDLYIIGHDPYADDYAEDKTSLGAAYVLMNENNIVPNDTGNRIVASWIGRPETTDEYNEILFLLARRWNAKIGFENDRGDVQGYAKRTKQLHLLAPEFELGWDEKIVTKNPNSRKYGMRMGSGKNNVKILTGNTYIAEWLNVNRGSTESGKNISNYRLIRDIGLLDELKSYRSDGNFDRISALRVAMYYMRELAYKGKAPSKNKKKHKSFNKFISHKRFV
jgi:hypothetical protein